MGHVRLAGRRPAVLGLALLIAAALGACAAPALPAPGTPGLNISTPLPLTPPPVPPTVTPPPPLATATVIAAATATPLLPASTPSSAPVVPTADVSLPQMVITNSAGSLVRLYVEIADTPEKQETGLMHRTAMAEDQGMLFVFPGETTVPFWMKDTLLPLSIAFIGADGALLDIQDMQPLDTALHIPAHPYVYALEVNQGYFVRHGIGVGNTARIPPLPTPTVPDASP